MASKSYYGHPANTAYTGKFQITEKNNISANTSTITWAFKVYRNDSYESSYSRATGNRVVIAIDGTTVLDTTNCGTVKAPNGETNAYTLASGSVTIPHDADGKKSFSFSAKYTNSNSSAISPLTVSGSHTCTTIARKSTITVPAFTMGTAGTISIARASTSFTHKLTYTFGSASGTIASAAGASASWTPPKTLGKQIPNATSGTGTIKCVTYDADGNTLGTYQTDFTLKVSDDMIPTFSSLTCEQKGSTVASGWGIYVQGKSKAALTISGAAGSQGSTIKAYSISGGRYKGSKSTLATGYLSSSGSITFTAQVKDSRGRWSEPKTVKINVVAYSNPSFSSVSTYRCTSGGTRSDSGTYFRAYTKFTYASCSGKNSVTCTVKYKRTNSSSWTTAGTLSSGTAGIFGSGNLTTSASYDVQYILKDSFGTTKYYDSYISSAYFTMHFLKGGKGIAMGKVAETEGLFDCNLDARFRGAATFNNPIKVPSGGLGRDMSTIPPYAFLRATSDFSEYPYIHYTATNNGALYATAENGYPQFGTLPIGQGGTGGTTAAEGRANLNAASLGFNVFAGSQQVDDSANIGRGFAIERTIDGVVYKTSYYVTSTGATYITNAVNENIVNYMILRSDASTFMRPLDLKGGGTGASTAAGARANLGIGTERFSASGVNALSSSVTTCEFNLSNYNFMILVGRPGSSSSYCTMVIPKIALTSANSKWQLADNNYFVSFNVKINNEVVTMTYVDSNSGGYITSVRGFN